ncbi:hypothetical protein Tco_1327961 [Tanacetum coccineum]
MNDDHEQTYHEPPKIINSTIGDDQINRNIIFDDPNMKVNNSCVDDDKYVHDPYELEQFSLIAYCRSWRVSNKAKVKTNENVEIKMIQSVQALFVLGLKSLSFYDPKMKHGLGYENTYMLKKAIAQNPKLYDAYCFNNSKMHVNVCDTEEILEDPTKS